MIFMRVFLSLLRNELRIFRSLFQTGAVTGCCLIDFQTARYSTLAQDLTTLIMAGTDKATRDKHWDDLLRHYHAVLQATLRDAGVKDPDALYSWDQFMVGPGWQGQGHTTRKCTRKCRHACRSSVLTCVRQSKSWLTLMPKIIPRSSCRGDCATTPGTGCT